MALRFDRQPIRTLRASLRGLEDATDNARFAREQARQALAEAVRLFEPVSPQRALAEAALQSAQDDLAAANAAEAGARASLLSELTRWLEDDATRQYVSPDADYSRLDAPGVPIALYPLRLETRFDISARTLRVRVYPDEILSNLHERALLPEERQAGDAYWDGVEPSSFGRNEIVARWTTLAARFGVARAAYIVRATVRQKPAQNVPSRAHAPSRPATALLPERWVVLAYKNGQLRHQQFGLPIPEPLDLTEDPSNEAAELVEVADGFTVPLPIAWTVHYERARDQGMAIDVPNLSSDELSGGFDRVLVLGVKTSLDPEEGTALLKAMFDGHHFTRGLGLLRQRTPTNNVPGRTTPFSMVDPSGEQSFLTQRAGPFTEPNGTPDYVYLASALLGERQEDLDTFAFIPGAEAENLQYEEYYGRAMRRALWPATLGYFMEQLMNPWGFLDGSTQNPVFAHEAANRAREYFVEHVVAQGPAPAFNIGSVPYGVIPALSLARWQPQSPDEDAFTRTLRRLLPFWQEAAKSVPKVTPNSANANLDLMRVISQKAGSDSVYVRNSLGPQSVTNLLQYVTAQVEQVFTDMRSLHAPILEALGRPEWAASRAIGLTFSAVAHAFGGPLVTANPRSDQLVSALSPQDASAPNYLARLAAADLRIGELTTQDSLDVVESPRPLLFLLLRHGLLLTAARAGRRLLPERFLALFRPQLEFELWGIAQADLSRSNVMQLLASPSAPGATETVFDRIRRMSDPPGTPESDLLEYFRFDFALATLTRPGVAQLERLLMETLDLCSHRLDAWVTSLATRRLTQQRDAMTGPEGTSLNYFGAYGWVENVKPVARGSRQVPGLGTADVQLGNGGFVHAPSLRHATTAAILRSGRMAEKGNDPNKYAVELPSERARRSRRLIEGLRADQWLGLVFGYEFEKGLRARGIAGTESAVVALRKLFPLVANRSGLDPNQPIDRIAAPDVVDGEKVRLASRPGANGIPYAKNGLPSATSELGQAIAAEANRLDEIMDGVSDLVISETIFQLASGDVLTANAMLSALPEGVHPPEPELTRTPGMGIGLSHRAVLLFEGDDGALPPVPPGWSSAATARGAVDPFLERWVAGLLGDADQTFAVATYDLGSTRDQLRQLALSELGIGALDFVALAQSAAGAGRGAALDRRFEFALLAGVKDATNVRITYPELASPARGLRQPLELGRAIGALIGGARELRAADLRRAGDLVTDAELEPLRALVAGKAAAALAQVETLLSLDTTAAPSEALLDFAQFIPDAFPEPGAGDLELALSIEAARSALRARQKDAQAALTTSSVSAELAGAIAALRSLFGRNTLAVLPAALPAAAVELRQSLDALARPALFSDAAALDAHQAPGRFLQQAMRVRAGLAAYRRLSLYLGAAALPEPALGIAQLPFVDGEDWVGRSVPRGSRTSLLLLTANGQPAPAPERLWRGLVLDEWSELVPGNKLETGVAFHYDSQNSEAPQVVLMCVNSGKDAGEGVTWNVAELAAIVNETIDLAGIRPVDSDKLALGQLTPAICLAANLENKTVSTLFPPPTLRGQPVVRE